MYFCKLQSKNKELPNRLLLNRLILLTSVTKKTLDNKNRNTGYRIMMAVTNDLVTDQRVHRSCMALTEAGYDVTLIGRLLPNSKPVERPYQTERMNLFFKKKAFFYAEYNIRLMLHMLFARTDAYYSNDTDTLPACYVASRLRGKPLFFDAHEMFPEVPELVGRPRIKRFWKGIEDYIFPRIAKNKRMAAATVCKSIADIYKNQYGISMAVVRNVPMKQEEAEEELQQVKTIITTITDIKSSKKILLYQGAVNIGRGIEAVMEAMPILEECHLVVAGVGDKYDELCARAHEMRCNNITFLGRLEPKVLRNLTKQADLGLSLLENRGLNYYYSFPNRIADFVQAGVPVLATDFPEIHSIVDGYGIGTLMAPAPFDSKTQTSLWPKPESMASIIRETIDYWSSIDEEEKHRRFAVAATELNWENDKKTLLNAINTIMYPV